MKITITGKNYNTYQHLENTIQKKLQKLDKYFAEESDAKVVLSQERGKNKIEVNINAKGAQFRTEQVSDDVYEGIDKAIDKLSNQMSKFKGKLKKRFQDNKSVRFEAIPEPETEAEDLGVVRTKKIDLQPMDVEEAVLQMEMGGHDFFVYEDEETGFVKVLYRRNDGGYGLLETSK
ncbi:MAG: ribosome-associated translation inhibitor RaiA [Clostridia bacterium]|nr:ribosome-associated translation inhibitor RaiA [Clostridia bacterium]